MNNISQLLYENILLHTVKRHDHVGYAACTQYSCSYPTMLCLANIFFTLTCIRPIRCWLLFLLQIPTTPKGWLAISEDFEISLNCPHCLRAMDGKHVLLQAPVSSGSVFYSHKSTFRIVLFALVDADYNFLLVIEVAKEEFQMEASSGIVN